MSAFWRVGDEGLETLADSSENMGEYERGGAESGPMADTNSNSKLRPLLPAKLPNMMATF